ncbi:hypothetical protein AAE021_06850 [Arthrobacter citreus]|uniref:DUF3139 domain-containing protein n=1 Tax=Arthrobacter citreus TaxID=1670 RepID=A0ABZ3A2Q3_9MICC
MPAAVLEELLHNDGMGKKWIMAVLVGMSLILGTGLIYVFLHPQLTLTLEDVMNSEYDAKDVTTEVREITEDACGHQLNCIEAYSTAEANYYRFRSHPAAANYASTVKDGFSVNYFVMDFDGKAASVQDQQSAMEQLAGTWNDYEGDFPSR